MFLVTLLTSVECCYFFLLIRWLISVLFGSSCYRCVGGAVGDCYSCCNEDGGDSDCCCCCCVGGDGRGGNVSAIVIVVVMMVVIVIALLCPCWL